MRFYSTVRGLIFLSLTMSTIACDEEDQDADIDTDTEVDTEVDTENIIAPDVEYGEMCKVTEYEDGADGAISKIENIAYDSSGRIVQKETDYESNGTIDDLVVYVYSSTDSTDMTTKMFRCDGNRIVLSSQTDTYDSYGNVIKNEYDDEGDEIIDQVDTFARAYDSDGNQLEEQFDEYNDGVFEFINSYFYDSNSNLYKIDYDDNADHLIDSSRTNTYDASNNLIKSILENDKEIIVYVCTYTYSADGNLIEAVVDEDGDGITDRIFTFTYDSDGNMTQEIHDGKFLDWGQVADGVPDRIMTYTYDLDGNLNVAEMDEDGDGTNDYLLTFDGCTHFNPTPFVI